jgi:signal transduction histidine kinase
MSNSDLILRPSLQSRVLPVVALLTAGFLVITGGATVFFQDRFYREARAEELRVQGEVLASGVMAALVFNDNRAAQEYADAMRANPDIEAVGIYPLKGNAVAGFVRPGGKSLPMQAATAGTTSYLANGLTVVLPVMERNQKVGFVYLRSPAEPFARRLARLTGILLLALTTTIVLAVFTLTQRALTRANSELENRADMLADANNRLQTEMEERSKAEEALRQAQKMEAVGRLSGGIAHDFNNLLTIVGGNLRLLQRRLAGEGRTDFDRYINSAKEGLDRAAILTQRILAFSRSQPLSPAPVYLSRMVASMKELLHHSVGEQIQTVLDLRSTWAVMCDTSQMENVILNLAINARDAMPDGGRLTITTEDIALGSRTPGFDDAAPGDYVRVIVTDTGVGMSEDIRSKAIDPFFTTKAVGQGTGLGLSTAFGYVRQSGGYLNIVSAPGHGTSVVIMMPKSKAVSTRMSA